MMKNIVFDFGRVMSAREKRLAFIKDEFRCLHNCEICGNSAFVSRSAVKILSEGGNDIRLVPSVVRPPSPVSKAKMFKLFFEIY